MMIEKLANALDDLLDEKTGIINTIEEYKAKSGSPPFFRYSVHICNTKAFCPQENFRTSIGIAITREQALAKAIGEGIERYCSAIYYKDDFPFCSYQEANFNCIHPQELTLYPSERYEEIKFSWKPFHKTTKVRWVAAIDMTNKSAITYVPAAYVYLPYLYGPSEDKIIQSISTGLACHMSHELAAINAICEVVERDAFMICWRNRLSPPKIKISTLPHVIQKMIQEYLAANYEVILLNITTDINIPTVLAALRSTLPNHPALVISAACKLSFESAIISALEELELTRTHCISLLDDPNNKNNDNNPFKNQHDHLSFWSKIENASHADFLFQENNEVDIANLSNLISHAPNEALNSIIKIFSDLKLRVLLADITSSDVSSYGFHVVRAIIPALHPLTFGYKNDAFDCERLSTVPKKLGLTVNPSNVYIPHPFP